jgi:hypothetical protein
MIHRGQHKGNLWVISLALLISLISASLFLFHDRVFGSTEEVVLSLRGFTSLGDELMPKLATAFLREENGCGTNGIESLLQRCDGPPLLAHMGRDSREARTAGNRDLPLRIKLSL